MPYLCAFLTTVITIAMVISPGAPGWNIFRMVSEQYHNIKKVEIVCSNTVIKQTFL